MADNSATLSPLTSIRPSSPLSSLMMLLAHEGRPVGAFGHGAPPRLCSDSTIEASKHPDKLPGRLRRYRKSGWLVSSESLWPDKSRRIRAAILSHRGCRSGINRHRARYSVTREQLVPAELHYFVTVALP